MSNKNNECVVVFKLREIMTDRGLTQVQVADSTGLTRQALVNLMRDPRAVQLETLAKLCSGLGVQPCDLFEVQ